MADHFMLIAIYIPQKIIKMCDSIIWDTAKTYNLPPYLIRDVNSFLDYYYPKKKDEWVVEDLLQEERFQNPLCEVDCGYHILNYIEAACENRRIHSQGNEFVKYKYHVIKTLQENKACNK